MRNLFKITLFSLTILICFNSAFSQAKKSKQLSKNLLQGRALTKYIQANFTCRFPNTEINCDERKFIDFIWKHWTEKTKAYTTITYFGIDSSLTKHIFIEPNKQNRWQVVQRVVRNHAFAKLNNLIEDLPTAFFVERVDDKSKSNEFTLVFKNKSGKIIKDF